MDRVRQHIVNEAGERLLRRSLPVIWVVRRVEQSEDYGIDFEVEVFSDEGSLAKSTGFTFKAQLKSSGKPRYLKSSSTISIILKKKHIAYYCNELNDPVIVIHADVVAERLFWIVPQLQTEIKCHADSRSDEKVSVRIPLDNELPATLPRMLRDAERAASAIATRIVVSTPIPELLHALEPEGHDEELAKSLRDRSDAIRLAGLQELFRARSHEKAEEVINRILHDSEASIENKFWALLEQERITLRRLADRRSPQAHGPNATLDIAQKLQKLTERGPAGLKFSALIMRKAAELDILSHRALGLFMNYKAHSNTGNPLWQAYALLEKTRTEVEVWRKYNQCVRLARYASRSKYRTTTSPALLRIVDALIVYLIVLDSEGKKEQALQYRKSAFQILQFAATIGQRAGDCVALKLAATLGIALARSGFSESSAWAERVAADIDDPAERADAEKRLDRAKARMAGVKLEGDIPTSEQQVYENMATALGIPLHDANHILTQMFRAGLQDANPTAFLRHCKHSFVHLGPVSMFQHILGEQLGLPIGPKVFECAMHGYFSIGGSLEEAYRQFDEHHCQSCSDRELQPADWTYSDEWHAQQRERVREARRKGKAARAMQDGRVGPQKFGAGTEGSPEAPERI